MLGTLRKKIGGSKGAGGPPGVAPSGGSGVVAGGPAPADPTRTPIPDPIPALATDVTDAAQCLKQIHAKALRNSAVTNTSIEAENSLSEAFGNYSSRLHLRDDSDEILGQCLGDLQQLIVYVQNLRGAMDGAIKGKVTIPMNEFIQEDLKRAKLSKKKFDKAVQNLDNAQNKVAQLQKGKINLVKIVEAEGERDALKKVFEDETAETIKVLKEVNDKNEFETLEQLLEYFEEYKKFFKSGYLRMNQLEPKLKEYRAAVESRKEAYRNEGRQLADRVRLSATTLEFKDLNVSLWDKENDKHKVTLIQLVEDERLYLKLLVSVMVNFRDVLLQDEKFTQKLEKNDVLVMFAGLSDLFKVHTLLHNELQAQLASYPHSDIGAVFLKHAQDLQIYPQFVIGHSSRIDAVERAEKNSSTIKTFLKVSEDKDEAHLRVLLSLPCSRIKKYEKVLQLMLEQVSSNDPQHKSLSEALNMLQMVQGAVEQGLEISDRLVKVLGVRNSLLGYDDVMNPLVDRHREYVTEGDLLVANSVAQKKPEEYRFFVFNNLILYTKKEGSLQSRIGISASKYRYAGSIPIQDGCSLREVIDNDVMHIRNAFELAWPGNSLIIMAPSYEDKQAWKSTLTGVLNSLATDRVFGIPLKDLMTGLDNGRDVPSIVEATIQWLKDTKSKHVEGIFRVSGMMTEVQEFRAKADQGHELIYPPNADPHCVAGVLKLWIRELPEPLLTYPLYDRLLATKRITDESTRVTETTALLRSLPDWNKFALEFIMQYLHEISLEHEENKMNSHNLSIVFGPNLLYRDSADPFDCSQFQEVYDVARFIIVHYPTLFKDIRAEREAFRSSHSHNPISSKPKPASTPRSPRAGATPTGVPVPVPVPVGGVGRSARPRPPTPSGPPPPRPGGSLPPRPVPSVPTVQGVPSPSQVPPPMPSPSSAPPPLSLSGGTGMNADIMKQLQSELARKKAPSPGSPPGGGSGGVPVPSSAPPAVGGSTPDKPPVSGLRKLPPRTPPGKPAPIKPLGPGGNGLAKSDETEQAEEPLTPPASPIGLPLCATCGKPITGKGINALDQKWHTECFVCAHCHQPFTGSYVPHQGKPYCTTHFTELFGKRCGGCSELITGAFLQAIGKDWHPEHFVCCNCQGSLTDGFFDLGDGRPVCSLCSPLFFQSDEGAAQN